MRTVSRLALAACVALAPAASSAQIADGRTASTSSSSRAVRYELGWGRGIPACEAFVSALNARSDRSSVIDLCDFPLADLGGRFSQPFWETLDHTAFPDVVKTIFVRGDYRRARASLLSKESENAADQNKVMEQQYWEPLKEQVLNALNKGSARLQRASFDVDNDGDIDAVYRLTQWELEPRLQDDRTTPIAQRRVQFSQVCRPGSAFRYLGAAELAQPRLGFGLNRYVSSSGHFVQFDGQTYFGTTAITEFLRTRTRTGGDINDLVLENEDGRSSGARCSVGEIK